MKLIAGTLTTALATLVVAMGSPATSSAALPNYSIAWDAEGLVTQIGPIQRSSTYGITQSLARKKLGKPSRTRTRWGSCQLQWKRHGVTAYFSNFGGARKPICKQRRAQLQSLSLARHPGADWHTADKGLRIGNSFETLTALYPETTSLETQHGTEWSVSPTFYSPIGDGGETSNVLARIDADGSISAFDLWIGGAGE